MPRLELMLHLRALLSVCLSVVLLLCESSVGGAESAASRAQLVASRAPRQLAAGDWSLHFVRANARQLANHRTLQLSDRQHSNFSSTDNEDADADAATCFIRSGILNGMRRCEKETDRKCALEMRRIARRATQKGESTARGWRWSRWWWCS